MAHDKEIKAAKKIADSWLKRSKDDEAYLIGMKKNSVAWEKSEIKRIEGMVASSDPNAQSAINACRKFLKDYKNDAEGCHKKHSDFVRGNPRAGNAGVCTEMKLKPTDPAYKAVTDSLSKMLMTHTPQFQATEAAWSNDLKPRIDMLESKLDSLEKLCNQAEGKMTVYRKQFEKDVATYKDQMSKAIPALKTDTFIPAINKMNQTPDTWLGGVAKIRKDQYVIYNNRIAVVEKLLAMSEKNYKRVLKNVPDDVKAKTFIFGGLLTSFKQERDKVDKELNTALGVFKTAKATFEKNFPDLV